MTRSIKGSGATLHCTWQPSFHMRESLSVHSWVHICMSPDTHEATELQASMPLAVRKQKYCIFFCLKCKKLTLCCQVCASLYGIAARHLRFQSFLTDKSTSNTKAKAAHPKDCCNRSGCLYSGHLRVMQLTCSSIGHFKM